MTIFHVNNWLFIPNCTIMEQEVNFNYYVRI